MKNIFLIDENEVIDLAVEHNLTPSNYFTLWNEMAEWQMDALLKCGLKNTSYVLDVGCGGMRLGVSLVDFLLDGHYFGTDTYLPYITYAHVLMKKLNLNKSYKIVHDDSFKFEDFKTNFDFAMAQSVVTHLSKEQTETCIRALKITMKPGGKFIFTFSIGANLTQGFLYDGVHAMRRPLIMDVEYFYKLGEIYSINFQLLDIKHPTNQLVGLYEF